RPALPRPRRRRHRVDRGRPASSGNPVCKRDRRYHHERPAGLRPLDHLKRPALVIVLSAVCLVAGLLAAVVATAANRPAQTTTATTASEPTTTSTTTGTTTTTEPTIADGVTIGGVAVGGITATQAYQAVTKAFYRPLILVVGRHRLSIPASTFGAVPYALRSVNRALVAPAGTAVRLDVGVSPKTVAAWL